MTHGTLAVAADDERYLPTVPGREHRDKPIYKFEGTSRLYTTFPISIYPAASQKM